MLYPPHYLYQVLPNVEPLSVKLRSYPFYTRAAAVPWFLTQDKLSPLHLRNVSLTAVFTLVHVVLAHRPPIVLLLGGIWTVPRGVIHALVQLHYCSRPHEVKVMRTKSLDLLRPVVSPIPLTPQYPDLG